jgi:hypothetical protein
MKKNVVLLLIFVFAVSCSETSTKKDKDSDIIQDSDFLEIDNDAIEELDDVLKPDDPEETDDFENIDDPDIDDEIDEDETIDEMGDELNDEAVDDDILSDEAKIEWLGDTATVTATGNELKTYTISTTASLRDNTPADKKRVVTENEGSMILRTGNTMIDALFAMTLEEVSENSVSQISDWSFNNGNPVDCDCFETGEKWKYVWTRDTAYAVDLGLAFVDPARSKNSLLFKISEKKASAGGADMEIIQDTGSGGSWPVSTDRVSWALGAYETLKYLEGSSYTDFLDKAYRNKKHCND